MKKVLSIALALVMMVACLPLNAEAAEKTVTLEVVPSKTTVEVGETVQFTVYATMSASITNIQFDVAYSDGLELVTTYDEEEEETIYGELGGHPGAESFTGVRYGYTGFNNKIKGSNVKLFSCICKVTAAGTQTLTIVDNAVLKAENNGTPFTVTPATGSVTGVKAPCTTHAYDNGAVTTAATCTAAGVKTYTCTECGATKTEAIAALGHDMSDAVETKAPTCTEEGLKTATCSRCGHEVSEPIAALGHDMGAYTQTKAPTCTAAGEETATCSRCDHKDTKPVAALGHDFGAYTVTKAPTCTAEGEETATCSRCDVTTTRPVEKVAHVDEDKDCKCDVCGNVAHVGETEWQVISEATCEENGKEAEFCKTCGKATGKERAIKANGHVDANKDGICDVCNKEVEHKHVDADKDGICDDPNCGQKIEASKTGDNASIALYATLMLAAAAVVVLRKRVEA